MRPGGMELRHFLAIIALFAIPAILGARESAASPPQLGVGFSELSIAVAPSDAGAIVGLVTRGAGGYWVIGADGGVFSYGGAPFLGSAADLALAEPIVAAMSSPSGAGYWLVASDGGVFSYGNAEFHGSLGLVRLDEPIVAAVPSPSGAGYWLIASDGGVFAFGDAGFYGSLGNIDLDGPIVDAVATPSGRGYLLLGRDGGLFAFGDAAFTGSAAGLLADTRAVSITDTAHPMITAANGTRWAIMSGAAHLVDTIDLPPLHEVFAADLAVVLIGQPPRRATIAVSGDIIVHDSVRRSAWTSNGYDFTNLFEGLRPVLEQADLAICHLEVVISATDRDLSSYPRFRSPHALAAGIASAGYDGCSTGSNHALDKGAGGVQSTLDALDEAGLGHTGTARSASERRSHQRYDVNGIHIAHLSYSYSFNGARVPDDSPWLANRLDPDTVLADAARAREAGADFVLVSLHWGTEYWSTPSPYQTEMAEVLLPSPAIDVIVGHHAHVIQPVGMVGDEYVVYGLGNSVSSMLTSVRRDGAVVFLDVVEQRDHTFEVETVSATPTWVDRPHAIVPADPVGVLSPSWSRTLSTLRRLGVEIDGIAVERRLGSAG